MVSVDQIDEQKDGGDRLEDDPSDEEKGWRRGGLVSSGDWASWCTGRD